MILDIQPKEYELTCSYFNKEGIVEYVRIPINPEDRFNWEHCQANDKDRDHTYKSWDGKPVKKVFGSGKYFRLSKYRIEELLQKYSDISAPLREFNMPRKYFIDIEVEVLDGFPDPESAQNKVTAIAIAGSDSKKILVLGLKDLNDAQCLKIEADINGHFSKFEDKWDFQYQKFESEAEMLETFFVNLMPKFSCVSGWNFTGYDWKYLLNRVDKIKLRYQDSNKIWQPIYNKCSPSEKLLGKNRYPQHRLIVDYMEIYNKWDKVIKVRENSKLDYVGKMAVGIEKIKYPGSFTDLYEKDFQKFVFYNAVDSILVHYIDKKLNTMLAYLKLAQVSGIEVKKAFSPIWIMEAMMNRKFLLRNEVFVYTGNDDEDQKAFEGAYVKEPVKGFHNWITCYDFASLYPNTMMQFNISPETFIGNNIEPKEGQIKVGEHTDEFGKVTWRVFDNSSDSIMRGILAELYGKRKETKQKYLSINKEIDYLSKYISKERLEKV
jgi:DNA polymerase elongation subunit (family B)